MQPDNEPGQSFLEAHLYHQLCSLSAQQPVSGFCVAFSGGLDSTVLLAACARVLQRDATTSLGPLRAIHINHGLQPEASAWVTHCQRVCAELTVPCDVLTVTLRPGNLEGRAREARYAAFRNNLKTHECLLMAHHQQDQEETILQRLFSGRGILPMPARKKLAEGTVLRPLLALEHDVLRAYAQDHGLEWIEDQSNTNTRFQRNLLRQRILPMVKQAWPSMTSGLLRLARMQDGVQAALAHSLSSVTNRFPVSLLPPEADARMAWLRTYLHLRGCYAVTDKALVEFLHQAAQAKHSLLVLATQQPPGQAMLRVYRGYIYFENQPPRMWEPQQIVLGDAMDCGYGQLSLQPAPGEQGLAFVYTEPLVVRPRRGGEYLERREGGRVAVKALLNQAGIPPWQRAYYPLLYQGEQLICVPGIAVTGQAQGSAGRPGARGCVARWSVRQSSGPAGGD